MTFIKIFWTSWIYIHKVEMQKFSSYKIMGKYIFKWHFIAQGQSPWIIFVQTWILPKQCDAVEVHYRKC